MTEALEAQHPQLAIAKYQRQLKTRQALYGPKDPRVADVMLRLGVCHINTGDLKKGRQMADQAVELLEAEYGNVSSPVADALTDIAVAYLERVRLQGWGEWAHRRGYLPAWVSSTSPYACGSGVGEVAGEQLGKLSA